MSRGHPARGPLRCLPAAILLITFFCTFLIIAAEVIPPLPQNHFNDYAHVVSPATASQLNGQLAEFERASSSQIVVAIYPKMQTASSIEDYATRVYNAWKVGLKGINNGAVLFVFVNDHKMRIQTGYGLEGALPDAICKRILDDEIAPYLKAGKFDAGMTAGVQAMMQAARGEYKGSSQTVRESRGTGSPAPKFSPFIFFIILFVIIAFSVSRRRGRYYTRRGYGWSGGWGGGDWGGGGLFSGGGGGGFSDGGSFSGGGGSSGGGGASGSW